MQRLDRHFSGLLRREASPFVPAVRARRVGLFEIPFSLREPIAPTTHRALHVASVYPMADVDSSYTGTGGGSVVCSWRRSYVWT